MERTGDYVTENSCKWRDNCDSLQVDMDLDTGLSQESVVSMSSSQLSQDSVASSHSTDLTSDLLTPEVSGKKKKKSGTKKVKKKKDKGDGETGEKVKKSKKDKKKKSRSSSSVRPEPEGGNPVNLVPMDEFDRVIYNNDPLFSDIEVSEEEDQSQKPQRPSRAPRPGGLMFSCLSLGIQSNTMIKYAIIGTEVQNILKVSLRRVGFKFGENPANSPLFLSMFNVFYELLHRSIMHCLSTFPSSDYATFKLSLKNWIFTKVLLRGE